MRELAAAQAQALAGEQENESPKAVAAALDTLKARDSSVRACVRLCGVGGWVGGRLRRNWVGGWVDMHSHVRALSFTLGRPLAGRLPR